MSLLENFDLVTVGIVIAGTLVLGFAVFFTDRTSTTNKSFFVFSIITALWGVVNYISYQFDSELVTLWLLRLVMFFAVLQAFSLVIFFKAFPEKHTKFKPVTKLVLLVIATVTAALTLTPLVFSSISRSGGTGNVATPITGQGILVFGIVSVIFVFLAIFFLLKKIRRVNDAIEKRRLELILLGVLLMFTLIIILNLILPVGFSDVRFIPYAALFTFPFILLISYSVFKHKLFNIKVAGVSLLVLALSVVAIIEVIFAHELALIVYRTSVFILILLIGILLIKGVLREVEQKEKIQKLAHDLEIANAKLRELDQLKSEFLSFATHQIRSPLTAIKGYASMIKEGDYGKTSQKVGGAVDVIEQSAESLIVIVNEFLNISRIEQGRMKYDMEDFDLGELAKQVSVEYEPNVQEKGLTLEFKQDERPYPVHADKGKIKQIIGNVIDNAVKYTPEGSIKILVTENSGLAKIDVTDTGIGIETEDIPKLFSKFGRTKDAFKTSVTGTGLGMYIAKQMLDAHNGDITVSSPGKSKGSTFTITIPLRQ